MRLFSLFALAWLSACIAFAEQPNAKLAVPELLDQKSAMHMIADVYKPDYDKAKTKPQKIELAKKLIKEGLATKDDSNGRFAIFKAAMNIAAQQGDLLTAFDAISRIDSDYEIDALHFQIGAATLATKSPVSPRESEVHTNLLLKVVDETIAKDRYVDASSAVNLAVLGARESRNTEMLRQTLVRVKEVKDVAAAFEGTRDSALALSENPTDPDANLNLGKFVCFYKGDWPSGLKMLAICNDAQLKALAILELGEKPDSLGIGDGWRSISEQLDGLEKEHIQKHSAAWYRKALPELSGLSRARVERLLTTLDPINAKAPTAPPAPRPGLEQRLQGTKWVNTNGLLIEWTNEGKCLRAGKSKVYDIISDRAVVIYFGADLPYTFIFDENLTRFDQFEGKVLKPVGKPALTGKRLK